jgi:methylenetetrahydrofolate--tRNA-(uracil-5-)-methyltransferase
VTPQVTVVGAGLAGCEAAWQAARRGLRVVLYEMKPVRFSPAHSAPDFAELVCSNSLRSNQLGNAVGLLKEEMRRLGSLVMAAADESAVPAGKALAVDRVAFARRITDTLESHPNVEVRRECIERIPDERPLVLATGPLTADALAADLRARLGEEYLYFYDALAPIVYADSIDPEIAFRASRWEDGEGDYWNLPLDRERYEAFVDALLAADSLPLHACEAALYFEGCLPIEEMARRGRDTLTFGPMKPVGLRDPRIGARPHAVVQLRQEDKRGLLLGLVGFQTRLRVADQKRVFRMLPGAEQAVFARYGSVHRNTYLNAPKHLALDLTLRGEPGLYAAGQITGVEGYVESAAIGLLAGVHVAYAARGEEPPLPDEATAHGALLRFLSGADPRGFQPMNVNYGLFPPLEGVPRRMTRIEKNQRLAERALARIAPYAERVGAPCA